MLSCVRHQGTLVKVRKHPVETEEQAKDRAWYVAIHIPADCDLEKESRSRAWANEKYFGMEYK